MLDEKHRCPARPPSSEAVYSFTAYSVMSSRHSWVQLHTLGLCAPYRQREPYFVQLWHHWNLRQSRQPDQGCHACSGQAAGPTMRLVRRGRFVDAGLHPG